MLGKSSGLNSTLRTLFAKIQKEFDFPAVTYIRTRIESRVHQLETTAMVTARVLPPIEASLVRNAQEFGVQLQHALLQPPSCRNVEPLSQLTTAVHAVPCWEKSNLMIRQPSLALPEFRVRRLKISAFKTRAIRPSFRLPMAKIQRSKFLLGTKVTRDGNRAKSFPLRLPYMHFDLLPKRLWIRYRSTILKQLNFKADQVLFLGIVFDLPQVPMQLIGLEERREGGIAIARFNGEGNDLLGQRVWIFIQIKDRPGIIPISLKKEE